MDAAEDLLNSPDYFTCDRLHCRMSKRSCLANQKLADDRKVRFDAYHGVDASTMNRHVTCFNCEQGRTIKAEDAKMGERGTCSNCKRPDVLLVAGMKDKICWACQRYAAGTSGEERTKKLADAAARRISRSCICWIANSRRIWKPVLPAPEHKQTMLTATSEDIERIEDNQVRIEAKIDRLMAVFGLSDGQTKRLSVPEMDEIIKRSVLRFRKKHQNND